MAFSGENSDASREVHPAFEWLCVATPAASNPKTSSGYRTRNGSKPHHRNVRLPKTETDDKIVCDVEIINFTVLLPKWMNHEHCAEPQPPPSPTERSRIQSYDIRKPYFFSRSVCE